MKSRLIHISLVAPSQKFSSLAKRNHEDIRPPVNYFISRNNKITKLPTTIITALEITIENIRRIHSIHGRREVLAIISRIVGLNTGNI